MFDSDIDLLQRNIQSILAQVDKLVLIDNSESTSNEVMKLITASSVLIISNNKNLGVAHALNQIKNSGQCCFWLTREWCNTFYPKGKVMVPYIDFLFECPHSIW